MSGTRPMFLVYSHTQRYAKWVTIESFPDMIIRLGFVESVVWARLCIRCHDSWQSAGDWTGCRFLQFDWLSEWEASSDSSDWGGAIIPSWANLWTRSRMETGNISEVDNCKARRVSVREPLLCLPKCKRAWTLLTSMIKCFAFSWLIVGSPG